MVSQIYPIKPQFNKANTFDTETLFSNLDLSITNGIVFEQVNFSFLDECFLLPFLLCKHFATYSFCESLFYVGNFNEETIFFKSSNYVYTLKSVLKWFRVDNYQGQ